MPSVSAEYGGLPVTRSKARPPESPRSRKSPWRISYRSTNPLATAERRARATLSAWASTVTNRAPGDATHRSCPPSQCHSPNPAPFSPSAPTKSHTKPSAHHPWKSDVHSPAARPKSCHKEPRKIPPRQPPAPPVLSARLRPAFENGLHLILHVSAVDHPGQNGNHSVNRLKVNDPSGLIPLGLGVQTSPQGSHLAPRDEHIASSKRKTLA